MADEEARVMREAVKYADTLIGRAQIETSEPAIFVAAMCVALKRISEAQGVDVSSFFELMARDFRKPGEDA